MAFKLPAVFSPPMHISLAPTPPVLTPLPPTLPSPLTFSTPTRRYMDLPRAYLEDNHGGILPAVAPLPALPHSPDPLMGYFVQFVARLIDEHYSRFALETRGVPRLFYASSD